MTAPRPAIVSMALGAALALLALSGCSGSSDQPRASGSSTSSAASSTTSASSAAADTSPEATPGEGACLEPMTEPIADGHQLPTMVPCTEPHGGEIVKVLTIGSGSDTAYPATRDSLRGTDDQLDMCAGTADKRGVAAVYLDAAPIVLTAEQAAGTGVTTAYAVSGIQYAFFVPGPAAWASGARWFACAVVLNNHLEAPSSYTGTLAGALGKPGQLAEEFSWCKHQDDSARRGEFTALPCSEPHNYEQLVSFDAAGGDAGFPGNDQLDEMAKALCPVVASAATGGRSERLPDGIGLGWTFPLDSEWANGDRTVRCYAVTEQGESTGGVGMGTSSLTTR